MKILTNIFSSAEKRRPPELPTGVRIYCVGDIHGRDDLLTVMNERIDEDRQGYTGRVYLIFLGDYVDRGPHSKEVIEKLLNRSWPDVETVFLRGNHEQTLLDFLLMESVGRGWLSFGGLATLASYGVNVVGIPGADEEYVRIQQELKEKLPPQHLRFFENTRLSFEMGSYFFVHAGVYPRLPLSKQLPNDLLWIRDDFIKSRKTFEKIIVHGHTIVSDVEMRPNRIGIDTGAYSTGILTCLVLEGEQQRLIQTGV